MLFYYVEHLCKATTRLDFERYALARTEALLLLYSMDKQRFLESGVICPNPDAVRHYLSMYHAPDLKGAAVKLVGEFMNSYQRTEMLELMSATEIALMRMVLIEKFEKPKASPLEKFEDLVAFMVRDLDVVLAHEAHFSLHYFHDRAGKMLGIQSNTPIERALATIRSTAWDILLLRFSEEFFSARHHVLRLGYIATQETRLASVARLLSVAALYGSADGRVFSVVGYDTTGLPSGVVLPEFMERPLTTARKRLPPCLHEALVTELRRVLPA